MLLPTPPPVSASPTGRIPLVILSMSDSGGPSSPASKANLTMTSAWEPVLDGNASDWT